MMGKCRTNNDKRQNVKNPKQSASYFMYQTNPNIPSKECKVFFLIFSFSFFQPLHCFVVTIANF